MAKQKIRKHCVTTAPLPASGEESKQRCFAKKADAKRYAAAKAEQLGAKRVEITTAEPTGGG